MTLFFQTSDVKLQDPRLSKVGRKTTAIFFQIFDGPNISEDKPHDTFFQISDEKLFSQNSNEKNQTG